MDKTLETLIGKTINEYIQIEWMRFTMFQVDDIYKSIPMLVFRVKEEDERFNLLVNCIKGFKGNIDWDIFRDPYTRKDNYIISVKELNQLYTLDKNDMPSQIEYFGKERFYNICDKAISDIPNLNDYIRTTCFII